MERTNSKQSVFYRLILLTLLFAFLLSSCLPQVGFIEDIPEATPAEENTLEAASTTIIVSATVEPTASPTVENTPTQTATATKEVTLTPKMTATPKATATPRELSKAQIRAEILRAGIILDDLASSTDEWTSSHMALDVIQDSIDNRNFGGEAENFVTTVVIGLEDSIKKPRDLDQAIATDGGWKLMAFVKVAFKDVEGNWQIAKIPVVAFHEETEMIWFKTPSVRMGGGNFLDFNEHMSSMSSKDLDFYYEKYSWSLDEKYPFFLDRDGNFNTRFIGYWTVSNDQYGYHNGTGSFIKFFTAWVDDPKYAKNDCIIGEPPRYTEEQLIEFRKTGDPNIFGYKDDKGYPIIWPLVTFQADLSNNSGYTIYNQP